MINWLKVLFLRIRLKRTHKKVQSLAKYIFNSRMKSIRIGQVFTQTVHKLEALGVTNPKDIVKGKK